MSHVASQSLVCICGGGGPGGGGGRTANQAQPQGRDRHQHNTRRGKGLLVTFGHSRAPTQWLTAQPQRTPSICCHNGARAVAVLRAPYYILHTCKAPPTSPSSFPPITPPYCAPWWLLMPAVVLTSWTTREELHVVLHQTAMHETLQMVPKQHEAPSPSPLPYARPHTTPFLRFSETPLVPWPPCPVLPSLLALPPCSSLTPPNNLKQQQLINSYPSPQRCMLCAAGHSSASTHKPKHALYPPPPRAPGVNTFRPRSTTTATGNKTCTCSPSC